MSEHVQEGPSQKTPQSKNWLKDMSDKKTVKVSKLAKKSPSAKMLKQTASHTRKRKTPDEINESWELDDSAIIQKVEQSMFDKFDKVEDSFLEKIGKNIDEKIETKLKELNIQKINDQIDKMIEKSFQKYTTEIEKQIEQKVDEKINKVNERIDAFVGTFDSYQNTKTSDYSQNIQAINDRISDIEQKLEENSRCLKSSIETFDDHIEHLEIHSRKLNIVFEGVPEKEGESCKQLAERIIRHDMHLPINDAVDIAHRLAKPSHSTRPAGLIVRLKSVADKSRIIENSSVLKGTGIFVRPDMPRSYQERKEYLSKALPSAKAIDPNAKLVKDKLRFKGKLYTANTIGDAKLSEGEHTKVLEDQVRFYGYLSPFSNFHKSKVVVNQISFNCVEQAFQYNKAMNAGYATCAYRIMNENNPVTMKRMTKLIPKHKVDEHVLIDIMEKAVYSKFTLNKELQVHLVNTGSRKMLECNPYDRFFSTGCRIHEACLNTLSYEGSNHLGSILERVRSQIVSLG